MKSKIRQIPGDASFRTFYRLTLNKNSKIIISAKKQKYHNLITYIAINKFLKKNKILTPKLFSYNFKKGIVVIEDFGNLSFYKFLQQKKNKLSIYKKIVDLLLKIQEIKPKFKLKDIFGKTYIIKKYTKNSLHKESDLFFDWYLPLILNKKKTINIKKETKKILSKLYSNLNFSNSYFVHRDFHSQNLMKVGSKIGLIDSQDALIGNPAYDLVSLIDDVRIRTSKKLKNEIYNYYIEKISKTRKFNPKKFKEDFNILSVQRSLKIIGIFSRLSKRDKKNKYLKYIPYTWRLLEMRMGSSLFLKLKKILNKNINISTRKKIEYK